jgi:multicomponent Na+:H+ antiporter subunit F
MNEMLLAAAGLIVFTVAVGIARILLASNDVERLMAVQLLGTGGIAALLLIAYATICSTQTRETLRRDHAP